MRTKTFATLLAFFSLVSCTSYRMNNALKSLNIYNDEVKVSTYTNGDKTIAYIPMKHIGTKTFYNNVALVTDSLASEGFVFFLEGTSIDSSKFSIQQIDTLELKLRKIIGVNVNSFVDTINNTIMGVPFKNKKGLINQPKYSNFGITKTNGKIVDIPVDLLIKEYENKYGAIILDECDYSTVPNIYYGCQKVPEQHKDYIVLDYRNINLAKNITNSSHKKIAVLYGARHQLGLHIELNKLDDSW